MTWLARLWADLAADLRYLGRRTDGWLTTYVRKPAVWHRLRTPEPFHPCCPEARCCPADCDGQHRTPCEVCQ